MLLSVHRQTIADVKVTERAAKSVGCGGSTWALDRSARTIRLIRQPPSARHNLEHASLVSFARFAKRAQARFPATCGVRLKRPRPGTQQQSSDNADTGHRWWRVCRATHENRRRK